MSGKILDYGQWSFIEFPAWKANKDFSNIAINAFTDYDDVSSIVFIDNISACETTGSDCAELQIDSAGNPIFPEGTASLPPDLVPTEVQDENYYNGSLPDLYGYDGTPAMYSNSEECFSLGEEEVPAEAQYFDCDASLKAAGIDMTCEELHAMMGQPFEPMEVKIQLLPALEPIVKDSEKCRMVGAKGY